MNSGDVVAVLDRIRRAGIDVWVEGGSGVDALLGEQTRPHDDLDLGVAKEDVDRLCDVLSEFERSDDDWPASFVLRDARGRKLDCHPLAFDAHGDGWQANSSGGPPNRWPRVDLTDRGSTAVWGCRASRPSSKSAGASTRISTTSIGATSDVCASGSRSTCRRCRARPGFVSSKRAVTER